VDGYLFTEDIDVSSVLTRDDLAAMLRKVHIRADRPSLRALEAEARHYKTPLSKTVVSEMLKGTRFPRKAVMLSFLRACGVAEKAMEPWRRSWERVATTDPGERSRLLPTEHDDGQPRSALQAIQGTASAQATEPAPSGGRENAVSAVVVTRLLPEATELADKPDRRNQPEGAPGPPVSRRQLGALLRQLRLNAGLTIEQVAARLLCSPSKVSRMETGFRAGTLRDIRDLCDLYTVTDQAQRDQLVELVRQSKRQGWWKSYDLPFAEDVQFGTYLGLEGDATSISIFHETLIPGLLQTADYARAVMAGLGDVTREAVEQYVAVRLRRQALLGQENPPQLHVVIDEAALRRRVGGSATMRAQLDQVVARCTLPNISVQVIPFDHGIYKAIEGGSFTILEFPGQITEIVYTEGLFGSMYLERPQDIERFKDAFVNMRSAAANDQESIALIAKIRRDTDDVN
jgi:transcriptional regulator with XRE-family HTH domain